MMINKFKYIASFIFVMLVSLSCHNKTKKSTQDNLFSLTPSQSSYIVKVHHKDFLKAHRSILVNAYLNATDQQYLYNLDFQGDFLIGINQSKSKLTGFVAIGSLSQTDTIFNGKVDTYNNVSIYTETYKKHTYYATIIEDKALVSNQKLFVENAIRNKEDLKNTAKDVDFQQGIKTFDDNADANIIVNLSKIKPDVFYKTLIQIKPKNWSHWQFFDLPVSENNVYSGLSIQQDSLGGFFDIFNNIAPVAHQFATYIPYSASQNVSISFDNYQQFYDALQSHPQTHPNNNQAGAYLSGLQALDFFVENNNQALLLYMPDSDSFVREEAAKVESFSGFDLYKNEHPDLIKQHFSGLFPEVSLPFYTHIDSYIILASNQAFLQKIIHDIENKSTLAYSQSYLKLASELPDNYHISIFKNKLRIDGKSYLEIQAYNNENGKVFSNLIIKPSRISKEEIMVEQVLSLPLKDMPLTPPQLVYNHKSKSFNIIYQNENKDLILMNLKGKKLWKRKLKDPIIGRIKQIDILRNHKLQYTFATPHHWHVIDRLGRDVEGFPQYFLQKITQGISVFDYDRNRKYRFGITQSRKFRLFDRDAKKVKGFKVKIDDDIAYPPKHFRIGNKDFILMQSDKGKLHLLNRRGETRIKVNQNFNTTKNRWGAYNKRFVNIDDEAHLISIDLSGKIKSAPMDLGTQVLSEIKQQTFSAVSGNKLLINKKLINLDLGSYNRPKIYKLAKKIYVFINNTDNNKIYAFDSNGQPIDKFPIIGHEILDIRSDKTGKYILAYDDAHNLIVYKF